MKHLDLLNRRTQVLDILSQYSLLPLLTGNALFDMSLVIQNPVYYKHYTLWNLKNLLKDGCKSSP